MEINSELARLDQLLLEMQCHCGHYPRLRKEVLYSEPAIITFFYECQCGNRTGNFFDKDAARAIWRHRHTWPAKNQKNT